MFDRVLQWKTIVSVETGALLVYSSLITYKRFSQRYQVNMMFYKDVIVDKTSSTHMLNACSLNVSEGNYLKTDGTKSNNTCSHVLLGHSNAFGLSRRNFLSRTSLPEPILCEEGGG